MQAFFKSVEEIKKDMADIRELQRDVNQMHEKGKTIVKSKEMQRHREDMQVGWVLMQHMHWTGIGSWWWQGSGTCIAHACMHPPICHLHVRIAPACAPAHEFMKQHSTEHGHEVACAACIAVHRKYRMHGAVSAHLRVLSAVPNCPSTAIARHACKHNQLLRPLPRRTKSTKSMHSRTK